MKLFLKFLVVALFAFLPVAGFWAGSRYQGTESPQSDTKIKSSSVLKKESASEETVDKTDCFQEFREESLESPLDPINWEEFKGTGFTVLYPPKEVVIEKVGDRSFYLDGAVAYKILSKSNNNVSAEITVYDPLKVHYKARYVHTSEINYEPYSNSWWRDFKECNPNSIGQTDFGEEVYSIEDGDAGYGFVNYFIAWREYGDGYEPMIVELAISYGGDDYLEEERLKDIVKVMIKSLKHQRTIKG